MSNIEFSQFSNGNQMQVGDQVVGLRSASNFRFAFPDIGIKDTNGNYLLQWASSGAAAVNYIKTTSASTGNAPTISSSGSDANPNLTLITKGSGNILFTPGGAGNIQCSTHLILSTSNPLSALEAASKGYVDSHLPTLPVSLANGGTSASLAASNGGIFYCSSTAGALLAGTATANQVLLSGSSSAPSWSTATYPSSTTINQILYSTASNVIGALSTSNNGLLVTGSSGAPSILAGPGTSGNILQSNAAAAPSFSSATYPSSTTANQILYSSSTNTVSGMVTAASSVLVTSAGGAPSLSQTLPLAVQGNITNVGTITSGTWNGSTVAPQYGGTGVNNGASTITIGGSFSMIGAFTFAGTLTGNTAVTFPTSGTLATTTSIPSLPISLANGGTGASLTASNGGIVYSNASALAILAGTSTANQVLMSGSNTSPSWSAAVYPSTTTASQLLYSSSANTVSGLTSANSSSLVTNSTGVPAWTSSLTNGQIIIGSTGGTPAPATISAGSGITITNAANSITISASTGGITWSTVSGTSQSASVNSGYVTNNAGAVTVTLPTTFLVGDTVVIKGLGAGGWILQAGASTTIRFGTSVTSTAGSLTSANRYDTVQVTGLVANTTWSVDFALSAGLTVA